jgi:threonine synthase
MESIQSQQPSTFAQMVDGLRNKSEEELKLLYLRFFASELTDEWKTITSSADFKDVSEENIIKAIQKNRYEQ